MKTLPIILFLLVSSACFPFLSSLADGANADPDSEEVSPFEKAVEIIKKYETIHQPKHWPFVGYGHKVLPGEKFSRTIALSESEADALLRKDLLKNCAVFRSYGADSLLLGVLAYNIGQGAVSRSSVASKLKAGDRDIRTNYISHCRYQGKVHSGIQQRRIEEFDALFEALASEEEKLASALSYPEQDYDPSFCNSDQSPSVISYANSSLLCTLH